MNPIKRKTTPLLITSLACLFLCALSPFAHSLTSSSSTQLTIKEANAGSKEAQFQLGYRYENGKQITRDINKAIGWYQKAANQGHIKAQDHLASFYYYKKQYTKARYWLKKRAEAGNSEAQFLYANTYRYGLGTKTSAQKSLNWYEKAAEKGHKQAQYELGRIYRNGSGVETNHEVALQWFKKAAAQGHQDAKTLVAKYEKNPLRETTQKANENDSQAQYELGMSYWYGKSTKKDDEKAYYWFKKAADNNHEKAQYNLAMMYLQGTSYINKDLEKAKLWLVKASDNELEDADKQLEELARVDQEQNQIDAFSHLVGRALLGDTETQYELGMRYLLGYQITADTQQAFYWLNEAAKSNHGLAMYQMANRYLKTGDSIQNKEKAIELYVAASKQNIRPAQTALYNLAQYGLRQLVDASMGDKEAQYLLANSYLQTGMSQEEKLRGLTWLKKSSAQNHIPALLDLGKIYEEGKLIPKNLNQAYEIYLSAAELNDPDAQIRLGYVNEQLKANQTNSEIATIENKKKQTESTEQDTTVQFTSLP